MTRSRYRIRFCKQGDLRWISHRDLVRVCERLFRRAELQLSMSEGFHPKPRMSFPSALSLGIVGRDEVLELELVGEMPADELRERLRSEAPPGLDFHAVELLEQGRKKGQAVAQTLEFLVPEDRRESVSEAIQEILSRESVRVVRETGTGSEERDVRPGIELLELVQGSLRMRLTMGRSGNAHPRDLLKLLGLDDLERDGGVLTRTSIKVEP